MTRITILAAAALLAATALLPGLSVAEFPDDLFPARQRTFEGSVSGFSYSGITIEGGVETAISGRFAFSPSGAIPSNSTLVELLYDNYPYTGLLDIALIEFYRNGDPGTLDALLCLQNRPQSETGVDQAFGHIRTGSLIAGHALLTGVVFLDGDVDIVDVVPGPDGTPVFSYTGSGNVLLINGAVRYKGGLKQNNTAVMSAYGFQSAPTEVTRALVFAGVLQEDTRRPVALKKIKISPARYELVDELAIPGP